MYDTERRKKKGIKERKEKGGKWRKRKKGGKQKWEENRFARFYLLE